MKKVLRIVAGLTAVLMMGLYLCLPIIAMTATDITTTSEAYIPSEIAMAPNDIILVGSAEVLADTIEEEIEDNITYITTSEYEFVETDEKEELETLMTECESRMVAAEEIIEDAKLLGYEDTNYVIVLAKSEYDTASGYLEIYQSKYDIIIAEEIKWNNRRSEYPEATEIWLYLKDQGFNDYVCAGIMGNLMSETGGHTLSLDIYDCHESYYGMCQWNVHHNPNVKGTDLTGQLDYLIGSMPSEFDSFGFLSGFTYETFQEITNEKVAAKAFAKTYERCGSAYIYCRETDATAAFEYFTAD